MRPSAPEPWMGVPHANIRTVAVLEAFDAAATEAAIRRRLWEVENGARLFTNTDRQRSLVDPIVKGY